jgi:hypothetical protein
MVITETPDLAESSACVSPKIQVFIGKTLAFCQDFPIFVA